MPKYKDIISNNSKYACYISYIISNKLVFTKNDPKIKDYLLVFIKSKKKTYLSKRNLLIFRNILKIKFKIKGFS
jgi:hypothetical protein